MCYEVNYMLSSLKSRVNRKIKILYAFYVVGIQTAYILVGCGMKVDKQTHPRLSAVVTVSAIGFTLNCGMFIFDSKETPSEAVDF